MNMVNQMASCLPKAKQQDVSLGSKGPGLTSFAKIYIVSVCLIALFVLLQQLVLPIPDAIGLAIFFVLGGAAQLLPIRFHKNASISLSMALALAAILVLGPIYAVWIKISSGLVHYFTIVRPKKAPFYRSAVTTSTLVIAVWVAGQVYVAIGGKVGVGSDSYSSLPPLAVAGLIYYVINSVLVTEAMALEQRTSFWSLFRMNFKWLTVNVASLTLLGFGIALIYQTIGLAGLVLFLLPIVLAWYSFHLYSRSVEDVRKANEELKEANERVRKVNTELSETNERLSNMSEVSRSLVGLLHPEETFDHIIAATKLLNYPAGFVAGPVRDGEARILNWHATHPAYAQWFLVKPDKAIRTAFAEIVLSVVNEPWFLAGEVRVWSSAELRLKSKNYGDLTSEEDQLSVLALIPLFVSGQPWGIIGVGSQNAPVPIEMKELAIFRALAESALEVALAHEQAERDALIDARTGLYNHRYFQEALERELRDAAARNSYLSFLMIDIDRFKEFNDLYGHLAGDQALQAVAQILRANIRSSDIACRYGGDEMCILMPLTDRPRAMEVAARIDDAVQNYRFRVRRRTGAREGEIEEPTLRVSIGVAAFPEAASTRASLIEQADRACYRAKALGGGVAAESGRPEADSRPIRLHVVK
jgi:diguanylate cyclase (GGDEF)-like protein